MFGSVGMPELIVILTIGLFWGGPIAAAVWAIVTLHRIRMGHQRVFRADTLAHAQCR